MLWHTFLLIFMGEMADKTQLLMLSFSKRYPLHQIIISLIIGVLLTCGFALGCGQIISKIIPLSYIQIVGAFCFIFFGLINLFDNKEEEGHHFTLSFAYLSISLAFFAAELGDKTQLTTIALSANHPNQLTLIYLGAFLGLVLANLIGLLFGRILTSYLNNDLMKLFSSLLFFYFGSTTIVEYFPMPFPLLALYCIILTIAAYFIYTSTHKHNML